MINHARTLLLNRRAVDMACEWSEYAESTFEATNLPVYLRYIWDILFDASSDAWLLNWRAHQYMTLLHGCQFNDHVVMHDKRLSYSIPLAPITTSLPAIMVSPSLGEDVVRLTGVPCEANGRLMHSIIASHNDGIMTVKPMGSHSSRQHQISIDGGFTSPIPLGASGMFISVAESLLDGYTQSFDILANPSTSISDVYRRLTRIPDEYVSSLFAAGAEPMATYAKLWHDGRSVLGRLEGLLLAVIYRHHEVRFG